MSAPEARLLGDAAAERFRVNALAVLSSAFSVAPALENLAVAVLTLSEDRHARIELAAAARSQLERADGRGGFATQWKENRPRQSARRLSPKGKKRYAEHHTMPSQSGSQI